jgi:ribulose 1,5-bisphosphate synthetase/thiazole synthase
LSDNALLNATYDYIIVGGGTSGLTVANRLTENGKCTVHPYPNEPSTGSLP